MDSLSQMQRFNAPCFHNGHYILQLTVVFQQNEAGTGLMCRLLPRMGSEI